MKTVHDSTVTGFGHSRRKFAFINQIDADIKKHQKPLLADRSSIQITVIDFVKNDNDFNEVVKLFDCKHLRVCNCNSNKKALQFFEKAQRKVISGEWKPESLPERIFVYDSANDQIIPLKYAMMFDDFLYSTAAVAYVVKTAQDVK